MSLKIEALNLMRNAVVIDLNEIFFTDFARLPLGSIDANRTVWHKVKGYPKNIELQVAATYTGGRSENDPADQDEHGVTQSTKEMGQCLARYLGSARNRQREE